MTFRLDGSAAGQHNGANGVVILLLFEGAAETVHTGIAVEEKRAGVVGDGVLVGVNEDRERGQLGESSRIMVSMAGVKTNFTPCLRREAMGRIRFAMSRRNFL